jgi:hypothetical protein
VSTVATSIRGVVAPSLGEGLSERVIRDRVRRDGAAIALSERARSGRARWATLRRWVRRVAVWWPNLPSATGHFEQRAAAFVVGIGPGLAGRAFLEAAMQALVRGGAVM